MDLSPDIRARFRECSEEFEQTALAKSSLLHRQCLSLFGSSVTVAAATVNTSRFALHCLHSMRPVVYIRSILLSAPQIVSQALTFDFRPSGCEMVDCHSDGHKALQSFLRTECDCVNHDVEYMQSWTT
ncbi:hypothetical protein D6C94_08920 [Aureobasidium pullulans]|uniref:Uncharacterized protein n=1 Tax=Aureobasidium pullulans TaxID=5580 RepID=A0AB38LM43_AURPU|nr:hypothetical protein D6C94_08920 [Aureobasidium pullulans]